MIITGFEEARNRVNFSSSVVHKNMFAVYDFKGDIGKAVIVVKSHPDKYIGKHVTQVIRVSDGKELLHDSMRPCDNMEDAVDVTAEMLADL